jgi:hypothetical protein
MRVSAVFILSVWHQFGTETRRRGIGHSASDRQPRTQRVETVELYLGRVWVEERRIVALAYPNGISPVLRIDLPFETDVQNFCAPPVKRLAVKRNHLNLAASQEREKMPDRIVWH